MLTAFVNTFVRKEKRCARMLGNAQRDHKFEKCVSGVSTKCVIELVIESNYGK